MQYVVTPASDGEWQFGASRMPTRSHRTGLREELRATQRPMRIQLGHLIFAWDSLCNHGLVLLESPRGTRSAVHEVSPPAEGLRIRYDAALEIRWS
ncbi:hypothetical protein BP5796_09808 [Coleophoma crateriformis]|uniref:Uncharacterized protein n=1 Tax=Coleophoma crateriformis TaxID=565419 RepID=A0A3D8QZ52_9HELO|nr:hypothetical protein BP5796_09808 [Coleophoma crateriformis]